MIGTLWTCDRYSRAPEKVEVVSETEKTVTIRTLGWNGKMREHRKNKVGFNLYQTWDEAKAALVERAEMALEASKIHVDSCRSALELAKALKMEVGK